MMKEIMEQPRAVKNTVEPRIRGGEIELRGLRAHGGGDKALQPGRHHRLRQRLSRRRRREVRHRVAVPRQRGDRARERAALQRPHHRRADAAHSREPVGRDGGHDRRDARVHGPRRAQPRHRQRRGQHDSPPRGQRDIHPRRPGDSRRHHERAIRPSSPSLYLFAAWYADKLGAIDGGRPARSS